jgi:hypothetical protein
VVRTERQKMRAGEMYDPFDVGSVVTRDVPDDVLAAGNPCRVIRAITD